MSKKLNLADISVTFSAGSNQIIVAEQNEYSYTLHLFLTEDEFVDWRSNNQSLNIIARSSAKGRLNRTIDHRNDHLFDFCQNCVAGKCDEHDPVISEYERFRDI